MTDDSRSRSKRSFDLADTARSPIRQLSKVFPWVTVFAAVLAALIVYYVGTRQSTVSSSQDYIAKLEAQLEKSQSSSKALETSLTKQISELEARVSSDSRTHKEQLAQIQASSRRDAAEAKAKLDRADGELASLRSQLRQCKAAQGGPTS